MTDGAGAPPARPAPSVLGVSGLRASTMGLGLAALGRPAYITLGRQRDLGTDRGAARMEERCHRVLDAAYAAGVRYVDVARSYGRAEEFLASWLASRALEPGAVTVGSKWGYLYVGHWRTDAAVHEVKDHSVAMLRQQWPETAALLGSHLGLYQVHSATLQSGVLDDPAVLAELLELTARGVVVGMSVSGPGQAEVIRRALSAEVDGVNPFSTVQATWNLLEPSAGDALAEAHARGWGVLVKEAVANGRLVDGQGDDSGAGAVLAGVARRHGASADQVALAAALGQPWSDVVLSGAVTERQLAANLGALAVVLDDDDRARLASVAEPPAAYWDRRAALPWQ
ncbi:MAG TPA: aldo/keto reductase [Acidimicrobiales bacterium]|nr:aldo/keto reductase [Acidimicrobiales bacterium]